MRGTVSRWYPRGVFADMQAVTVNSHRPRHPPIPSLPSSCSLGSRSRVRLGPFIGVSVIRAQPPSNGSALPTPNIPQRGQHTHAMPYSSRSALPTSDLPHWDQHTLTHRHRPEWSSPVSSRLLRGRPMSPASLRPESSSSPISHHPRCQTV